MKTLRTILLIAGILVEGLALNISFAQSTHERDKKDRSSKSELKAEVKAHPKLKSKSQKHEVKEARRREQKAQKEIYKNEQKVKIKEEKRKWKS